MKWDMEWFRWMLSSVNTGSVWGVSVQNLRQVPIKYAGLSAE